MGVAGRQTGGAMLTVGVNIAVFAAFRSVIGITLLSHAAFKPICRLRARDMWCYGWQMRQETARSGKADGAILTNPARIWRFHDTMGTSGDARRTTDCARMRMFQVRWARTGAALIELICHRLGRLSRMVAADCRDRVRAPA